MRLEREDRTPVRHEVWAVLGQTEAFDLMRALEEYFALGAVGRRWHTHIGTGQAELTITVEADVQVPIAAPPVEDMDSWLLQEKAGETLITADEHFAALRAANPILRAIILRRLRIRERDDPRTFEAILGALKSDPSPIVRREAANQLADYREDERIVTALREAFAFDSAAEVRWEASEMLVRTLGQPYP